MASIIDPQVLLAALNENALKLLVAILFLLIGFILGRLVGKFLLRILKEVEVNKLVYDTFRVKLNADHLISTIVTMVIYFLALVAALEQIGIANTLLYILSLAIIVVAIVSFFMTVRDFFPNLMSGFYLQTNDKLKDGAHVEIDDIKGELVHIDLVHTIIKTKSGDILYIPNSTVAKSKIKILKNQ
jgi:small-conductance mechanosensitive channel